MTVGGSRKRKAWQYLFGPEEQGEREGKGSS
jgi:hypothetical protein